MKKQPWIFGKPLRLSWTEIILGAAAILLGLLLLIWPNLAVNVLLNGIGIFCIVVGVILIVRYFMLDTRQAIVSNDLAIGLTWIAGGVLIIALKSLLISILPFFFGLIVLIGGLVKVQGALSFKRMNSVHWYLELICALVSILLGVLILINPFSTAMLLMRVIGAALLIEGVSDLISCRQFKRTKEQFFIEFEEDK